MKTFFLTICFFFLFIAGYAQQNNFVYLQSDNKQPFYIKLNDKIYSSSAGGYTILSKLQKGTYAIVVGFPKNEWPQQQIRLEVKGDAGYLLKLFDNKGWGLYDMQTMNITMATSGNEAGSSSASTARKTDDFTNTLAGVVNTPSIKDTTPVVIPVVQEVKIVQPAAEKEKPASIVALKRTTDQSGSSMVYVDLSGNAADTVMVFIPSDTKAVEDVPVAGTKAVITKVADTKVGTDQKFLDIELVNPNSDKDSIPNALATSASGKAGVRTGVVETDKPVTKGSAGSVPTKTLSFNSDCRSLATDEDFLKIRKKMAAEDTQDDMIAAARKMFKSKCYSTDQVKNLSVLFLNDEGKYHFFDAAYPFVHDTQHFSTLESQFSDTYYITRFRAMIRN